MGWVSQFFFMPLMTFLASKAFGFSNLMAIGCILTGISPGGATSNLFTYWSKGDLALSITITLISTLSATFMMPVSDIVVSC